VSTTLGAFHAYLADIGLFSLLVGDGFAAINATLNAPVGVSSDGAGGALISGNADCRVLYLSYHPLAIACFILLNGDPMFFLYTQTPEITAYDR
jgi:hypothetical protein